MENIESFNKENLFEKKEKHPLKEDILNEASIAYEEKNIPLSVSPEKARDLKEEIENMKEYKDYLQRDVSMEDVAEKINSLEKETDNKDVKTVTSFIRETAENISELCFRYAKIIKKIEKFSNMERFRLDPSGYQEKLKEYDRKRRECHNSIVSSLTSIRRNIEEKLIKDFKLDIDPDITLSFDALKDRDYISKWAQITATGKELEEYHEKLTQVEKDVA